MLEDSTMLHETGELMLYEDNDQMIFESEALEGFQVFVGGENVTNRIQITLQITDNINQRRDSVRFQVKKAPGQEFAPQLNQEIIVFKNGVRIFGGVISSVRTRVESINHVIYDVSGVDYSFLLDRKLLLERLRDKTITEILEFLLNKYDDEGFTMNHVQGDQFIKSITFNRVTFSEALNNLAEITGYSWYVDYHKSIHFFPKNEEPAPFNLTDTSGNYVWSSLEINNDLTQIRNVVYIEGGEEEGNERTEEFTAEGDEDERTYYRLAHKFSEMPTVTLNGNPVNVGVEFLNPDGDFEAMWSFKEKYIRFTSGNIPSVNDVVKVTGIPLFPIIGRIQDSHSVLEFGVYEHKIKDKTISSREDARLRGKAELEAYKNGVVEGMFRTYNPGLRSGQVININSPIRGVDEPFLIQSVNFRMRTPEDGEWVVTLATLRTVGIIDFLQNLLKEKDIIDESQDFLLSFRDFQDNLTVKDGDMQISVTSPPYMWMPADPDDDAAIIAANPDKTPGRWNFSTWGDVES